ncbi:hypothetical protein Tco_0937992 [Tanacetum coccineum]|uniref:Aminotransferase-like plant mobile domain-containing protein n=1 Tax=Tanacetum coccineum TaxID=301880 RepID=A0ABQ5DGK2_9ASTR
MLGRQVFTDDENENIPLYYHVVDKFQIQFGREEFCLVTGLKFGVENWTDYNDEAEPIPFRRRVFSSSLDGQPIRGKHVEALINSKAFKKLDDNDVDSLCCVGILQLVLLGLEDRCHVPNWILWLANDKDDEVDKKSYSITGFLWAFKMWILESFRAATNDYYTRYRRLPRIVAWSSKNKFYLRMLKPFLHGQLPVERLVPHEIEARSRWWVSSRAYFDGRNIEDERIPRHLNRNNYFEVPSEMYREFEEQRRGYRQMMQKSDDMYEKMSRFMEDTRVVLVPQANKEPIIADQHYGISDLSRFQSYHTPSNWQTPNPSYLGTPNSQPPIPSHPGTSNWQNPMTSYSPNLPPPFPSHRHDAGLLIPIDLSTVLIPNDGSLEEAFTEMMNHVITNYTSDSEDNKREVTQNDYTFNQMVEWAEQEHFEDEETKLSCPKIDLSTSMADSANDARKTIVSNLQRELEAEATLANTMLGNLTRYFKQMCIREIQITMLQNMPTMSLNSYGLHALLMTHEADIRTTNNLIRARQELLRSIAENQNFINNYRAI